MLMILLLILPETKVIINAVIHYNNVKIGLIDILYEMSEYVILVQLMDVFGNFNHAVSIYGVCKYYLEYKGEIPSVK